MNHTSRESFEAAVLPLRRDLLGMAFRYTSNRRDAEDLVQDTLLKAYLAWNHFEVEGNARPWCQRILRNTFISRYRRRFLEARTLAREPGRLEAMMSAGSRHAAEDPETQLLFGQFGDELASALRGLSDDFREVLLRYHVDGASYEEIARDLEIPLGTVMSRLHRARQALRGQLTAYAGDRGIGRTAAGAEPLAA